MRDVTDNDIAKLESMLARGNASAGVALLLLDFLRWMEIQDND